MLKADALVTRDALLRPTQSRKFAVAGAVVLTMDPQLGNLADADVLVDGDSIVGVGRGLAADLGDDWVIIDGDGIVVMPGFVDTHRHCWENQLRQAIPDADIGEYATAFHRTLAPKYTPEDMYAGGLISGLGAINAGITCLVDWSHNSRTPGHNDGAIGGLRESGIRGTHVFGPALFIDDQQNHPNDLPRLLEEHFAGTDQLLSVTMGTFAWSVPRLGLDEADHHLSPDPDVETALKVARAHGVRISMDSVHNAPASATIGRLHKQGLLGDDITLVHCTDLTDDAWRMIADGGCSVSVAGPSEIQLNVGEPVPATQKALDHGIRPSLSADVEVSLPGDFFSVMRTTQMAQRQESFLAAKADPGSARDLLTVHDILDFATYQGARAMGLEDKIGSIKPGKQADIILLRCDTISTLPMSNAMGTVVAGCDTSNVESVFIAGEPRKLYGEMVNVDIESVKRIARESQARLLDACEMELDPTRTDYHRQLVARDRFEAEQRLGSLT